MLEKETIQTLSEFMEFMELPLEKATDAVEEARTCFLDYNCPPTEMESAEIFMYMFRRGMKIRPNRRLMRYERACKALFDYACGHDAGNDRYVDALIVIGGGVL